MRFHHQLPDSNSENLADTYDTILSVKPTTQKNLLEHIQVGLPNPMDLILSGEMGPAGSILAHAAVEPVISQAVVQPVAPQVHVSQDNVVPMPQHVPSEPVHHQSASAVPNPYGVIIEQGVPLSRCKLWEMLINYYAQQGINAWQNSVPNYITSSVYMAEAYAENIMAFLEDYLPRLDLNEPVYIVEMATGTGRFSFHMLRELERKLACFSRFKDLKLRYVMTDFTDSNVEFWQSHERFAPYAEKGILDFAVFNPLASQSFDLKKSGLHLDSQQVKNPLIAIANYFFDSTPVDVFLMKDKRVHEGLVSLERNMEGVDPASYPHISQITTHFEYRQLSHHHYYWDYDLNAILNTYRKNMDDAHILFPVGAFDVVSNLRLLSNDRLVLLSSDKGYTNPGVMTMYDKHEFVAHDGTFSFMVNYDALGHYFNNMGGRYFASNLHHLSVQTACLISMAEDNHPYERVRYFFRERINRQNLPNSLCGILPGRENYEEPNDRLSHLISQIRLHQADPFVFTALSQPLIDHVAHTWAGQRFELMRLLDLALDNFYFYPGVANLPFQVAPIFFLKGMFEKSLECLKLSAQFFGESSLHHFLAAQNCEGLGRLKEAQLHYSLALQMNPDMSEARSNLESLLKDLEERMKSQ